MKNNSKNTNPKKWRGLDSQWEDALSSLCKISEEYIQHVFDYDEHTTKHEARMEFRARLAESYGFAMPKPEQSPTPEGEKEGE